MNMFNNKEISDGEKPQKVSVFRKRSFQFGSVATAFTAIFIAVIVALNVGVTWLSERYPISADLTKKQTFKVSAQSIKFLKSVDKPITIDVLATKEQFLGSSYGPCAKIIDKYPQYNHNITVNYINLNNNPVYASRYSKEDLQTGDIIVRSGDRYKHVTVGDLATTSTDSNYNTQITGYTTEESLDTAILYVTTNDLPTITFTTGHGEVDSSALQSLLTKNNYQIKTQNVSTDGLDENANVIAIVYPKTDFTSDEIKKLDDFISAGAQKGNAKNLLVFFDPRQSALPNLETYLQGWGIGVGTGAIHDSKNSIGNQFYILNGSTDSGTVGSLPSGQNGEIADSRPLNLLFQTKGAITTTSVLSSMDTSKLWDPPAGVNNDQNGPSDSDKNGPFTIMAKAVKNEVYNNKSVNTTVLVSGSTDAFNSNLLTQPNLNNADIILNSVNNLVNFKTPINVEPKDASTTQLNIPAKQQKLMLILFIFIIPLLVLAWGLGVFLRRRHL